MIFFSGSMGGLKSFVFMVLITFIKKVSFIYCGLYTVICIDLWLYTLLLSDLLSKG